MYPEVEALFNEIDEIKATAKREKRELTAVENAKISATLGVVAVFDSLPSAKPNRPDPGDAPGGSIRANGYRDARSEREKKDRPFASLAEQMSSIRAAGTPGGIEDPRLHIVAAASGLSEGVPSDGGFLLQDTYARDLLQKVYSTGDLLGRCQRFQLGKNSNTLKIPTISETSRANGSRWGGLQAFWGNEGGLLSASEPDFGQIEMSAEKVTVLVYATGELFEDAEQLSQFLEIACPDEIRFVVEDEIVNGSGVGRPLGILNSPCKITVDKEVGQVANSLIYENLLNMWSRMWGRSRRNAIWMIDQSIEPQLYTMSLPVGTGGAPVFMPGGGVSEAPYATLFGRPMIPIEYGQQLGTEGDIILADMSQYIVADKGGVRGDVSMHVRFIYDEQTFRFIYRVNGHTWWTSAIQPKSGGDTLSPIISLADRT